MRVFKTNILGLFLVLLGCNVGQLHAQSVEIGGFGGLGWYKGDVGKAFHISTNDLAFGGFMRYNFFNKRYAFRAHLIVGSFSNADSLAPEPYKQERNLSFKTNVQEIGVVIEFNFQEYKSGTEDWYTPYIFSGLVVYRFNPTANLGGRIYDLQPLHTEGQGTSINNQAPYKLLKVGIPIGIGYKISIGKFAAISVEGGFRISRSDYLDDASTNYTDVSVLANEVSPIAAALADRSTSSGDKTAYQRADPYTDDIYGFVGMTVVLHLDFKKRDNCYFR